MARAKTVIRKKGEGAYHHGDLKASLKKAALRLVREKGPRGFSINEASRLAGVTAGAPYRHFADKDALLSDVAREGYELMASEIRTSIREISGLRNKIVESGMAYIRFAIGHADYFTVMFQSGLDKSKYPMLAKSGQEAFAIILELSTELEKTPEAGLQRATAAWALVHGLATLEAEGALSLMPHRPNLEHLRPLLERFVSGR
jgi:AcrR family transcriptional regulator